MKRIVFLLSAGLLALAAHGRAFKANEELWPGVWIWGGRTAEARPLRVDFREYLEKRPGGWATSLVHRLAGDAAAGGAPALYVMLQDREGNALFPSAAGRVLCWPAWGVDFAEYDYPGELRKLMAPLAIPVKLVASPAFEAEAVKRYGREAVTAELPPGCLDAAALRAEAMAAKFLDRRTFEFRREFELAEPVAAARLLVTADRSYELILNGQPVGNDSEYWEGETYDVAKLLKPGKNLIAVTVKPDARLAGLLLALEYKDRHGVVATIATGPDWQARAEGETDFGPVVCTGFQGAGPRFRLKEPWRNPTPLLADLAAAEPEAEKAVLTLDFDRLKPGPLKTDARWTPGREPAEIVEAAGRGRVLRVGSSARGFSYNLLRLPPSYSGTVTVEFDFLPPASPVMVNVAVAPPGKPAAAPEEALCWLAFDGRTGQLSAFSSRWEPIGALVPGEWQKVRFRLWLSGDRRGTMDVALNGVDRKYALQWRNRPELSEFNPVASIYFISRAPAGDGALLIDNLKVSYGGGPKPTGRIRREDFRSEVLNKPKYYNVVLPADYEGRAEWPVLFLLHGRGRNPDSLLDSPLALAAFREAPFITVLPPGDDGWYINSPVAAADRYADFLDEVMALAAAKYRISARREWRGVCGWSMGGYGAAMTAERRPEHFSLLMSSIGLLDFPRGEGYFPKGFNYRVPANRFGRNEAQFDAFNPLSRVAALKDFTVLLVMGKQAFDLEMNRNFAAALRAAGVEPAVVELPGGHWFVTVEQSIPHFIDHANRHFKQFKGE